MADLLLVTWSLQVPWGLEPSLGLEAKRNGRVSSALHGLSGNNLSRTELLVRRGEVGKRKRYELGAQEMVESEARMESGVHTLGWGWGYLMYVLEDLIFCLYLFI